MMLRRYIYTGSRGYIKPLAYSWCAVGFGMGLLRKGTAREGAAVRSVGPTAGPCRRPWRGPAGYPQAQLWGLLWALSHMHVPCGAAAAGLSVGLGLCPVPGGLLCYYLNRDSAIRQPTGYVPISDSFFCINSDFLIHRMINQPPGSIAHD